MGFFKTLFSKKPGARELKVALAKVDNERKKKQLELSRMFTTWERLRGEIIAARKTGKDYEVDYLYEDYKTSEIDIKMGKREVKVLNLEGIALKRYIRAMERLEKAKDKNGVQALLKRMQESSLDEKLMGAAVDEQAYMDELKANLDVAESMMEEAAGVDDHDPEKAKFLSQIDDLISMEEGGELDQLRAKEDSLRRELEKEKGQ